MSAAAADPAAEPTARNALRMENSADSGGANTGFRCAMTLETKKGERKKQKREKKKKKKKEATARVEL